MENNVVSFIAENIFLFLPLVITGIVVTLYLYITGSRDGTEIKDDLDDTKGQNAAKKEINKYVDACADIYRKADIDLFIDENTYCAICAIFDFEDKGKEIEELYGEDKILEHKPEMGAEDFAFFTEMVPGAMFNLGCRIEGDVRRHHDPRFDINEDCLPVVVAILTEATLALLAGVE